MCATVRPPVFENGTTKTDPGFAPALKRVVARLVGVSQFEASQM